jgi:hypothetical protein
LGSHTGHGAHRHDLDTHQAGTELPAQSRGGQIRLGEEHHWSRATIPSQRDLALYASDRQPVGRCRDQDQVDIRREHLGAPRGVSAGQLGPPASNADDDSVLLLDVSDDPVAHRRKFPRADSTIAALG